MKTFYLALNISAFLAVEENEFCSFLSPKNEEEAQDQSQQVSVTPKPSFMTNPTLF